MKLILHRLSWISKVKCVYSILSNLTNCVSGEFPMKEGLEQRQSVLVAVVNTRRGKVVTTNLLKRDCLSSLSANKKSLRATFSTCACPTMSFVTASSP